MKKKIYFLPLLLLGCVFTLSAQSIYRENSVRYPGIEEIRTYHLYNKKNNPACNLKINFFYPEIYSNETLSEILQFYFIEGFFGAEYANLTPKEAVKAYSKAYEEEYKRMFEDSDIFKNEVEKVTESGEDIQNYVSLYVFQKEMRNTILFNNGNVISQVINIHEYTGGAHGASSTQGMVLDINTGKKIQYEEIFYPHTEEAISALLLANLMKERKYTSQGALIDAGFNFEVIPTTPNFVADDKGITFIYNPYELGAYVLGIVEIFVPYSDLVIYMKPDSTLFRWAINRHAGNLIKFETVMVNQEYFGREIEPFPSFTTDMQFTFPSAYYDQEKLQEFQQLFIANAFGKEYITYPASEVPDVFYENMLSEYQKVVNANEEIIKKGINDPDNSGDMWTLLTKDYAQKNNFYYNRNDLISYSIEVYSYDGETLGASTEIGFVVDIKNARNLNYEDIFKPDTQKGIVALLLDKLEGTGYEIDQIRSYNNFYMNEEGIIFIFNPYNEQTNATGIHKIVLPYSEIMDYIIVSGPIKEVVSNARFPLED